jgi:hypothetical protein
MATEREHTRSTTEATEPRYTVMPLSGLKKLHKELFDALRADKTVYVSKHGRVIAAFRPYAYVPESVAAVYASPNLELPTITARDIQRTSLSKPIAAAAAGLPAVVEKDSRIYGMLTPATTPAPETVPDPDTVGAKAQAMMDFQERNPRASIAEVMAFADSLDSAPAQPAPAAAWPLAADFATADGVSLDIKGWREQGSDVEDVVEELLDALERGIKAAGRTNGSSVRKPPKLRTLTPPPVTGGAVPASSRSFVRNAEQLEAAGEAVDARAGYVRALTTEPLPNVGVMWRLGNLARRTGHLSEAARWFRFSLAYDAIADGPDWRH